MSSDYSIQLLVVGGLLLFGSFLFFLPANDVTRDYRTDDGEAARDKSGEERDRYDQANTVENISMIGIGFGVLFVVLGLIQWEMRHKKVNRQQFPYPPWYPPPPPAMQCHTCGPVRRGGDDCPGCGENLVDGARFCHHCGEKI